jgi:hypothetical protein
MRHDHRKINNLREMNDSLRDELIACKTYSFDDGKDRQTCSYG